MRLTLKHWFLTAAFLIFSQLIFWPIVHYAEQISRPAQIDQRGTLELQALDAKRNVMNDGKRYVAKRDKQKGYYAPLVSGASYSRFFVPFETDGRANDLGLYMSLRDDVVEVRLNDMIIQPEVTVSRQQGAVNSGPQFIPLPPAALRSGENVIALDLANSGTVNDFPTFSVGDAANLSTAHRLRNLILVDLPLAGIAILIFTVLLCAVVDWPKEDRPRIRAIMLLLGLSAASTAVLSYAPQDWPYMVTIALYVLSSIGIGLAALQYAQSDGHIGLLSTRNLRWTWIVLPALFVLPLLWILVEPASAARIVSDVIMASFWLVSALCIIAAIMLAIATVRSGWVSWLERLLLILCFSFFALDRLGTIFELHSLFDRTIPLTLPWSPVIGVVLGLSMILSLARQAAEARKTVTQSNEILAAKLTEQDAELARQYQAQKQMLQRQVMLEERQRIVRDMHDGIGGQLLGLMMQVRGGGTEPKVIEEGLQSSIADLRLIVDSMDTADEGLAQTLRSFEHRVRAQVEAAGIEFAVEHGLSEDQPGPGPRPTLQVLRIIQEAVTNAMRHSGAKQIKLASQLGEDGLIQISVYDNGRGMPEEIKGGRGLASMRSRAEAVGGTLTFDSGVKGTGVHLTFPAPLA